MKSEVAMRGNSAQDTITDFEQALAKAEEEIYVLRLYVVGASARSAQAIANVKKVCEERLAGRYQLEVVDVYQNPGLAAGEQIIAVPTLIKSLPRPLRRLIGDMSNINRILLGMDLAPKRSE
jgi:circadian clock protein KaiB